MAILSTIAAGVGIASGVSGLFSKKGGQAGGSRHSKKNKEYERNKLVMTREAAERGGFNPLTALNSGVTIGQSGGSSFSSEGVSPLASAQLISQSLQDLDYDYSGQAQRDQAREELETERLELEVERLRAGGASDVVNTGKRGMAQKETVQGPAPLMKPGPNLATNPYGYRNDGSRAWVSPRNADAEHGEQRYGDVAQEVFGALNLIEDYSYDREMDQLHETYGPRGTDYVHTVYGSDRSKTFDQVKSEAAGLFPPSYIRPKIRGFKPVGGSHPYNR